MTNNSKALTGILVLIFPFLVLAGMTVKATTGQHIGQQIWQVKITGYDPRDPLYGHYLRFRYDWNMAENQNSAPLNGTKDVCLCLNRSSDDFKNPKVSPIHCKAPSSNDYGSARCESVIKVHKHGSFYSLNRNETSEKYFIPEENSDIVDRLFRLGETEFTMEIMAHKNNSVSVRNLYVGDTPLNEYLRNMPKTTGK